MALQTHVLAAVIVALVGGAPATARAQDAGGSGAGGDPPAGTARDAVMAPLATRSLLLDVEAVPGAPGRLVAVGERGHVIVSEDGGATWTQSRVPTRANLTAVEFVDPRHGWAVGHDEVILRTTDGGLTWERSHFRPEREQPLLDVWFGDERNGLAVGAFASVYRTADGGVTWEQVPFEPAAAAGAAPSPPGGTGDAEEFEDEIVEPHLNAIAGSSTGRLYVGAEAGRLYRSDDGGQTWRELPSPYEGSFFGLLPLDGDALLAFGLRGHLFRSDDAGLTWRQLDSGTGALLAGATRLADGTILVAGLAGAILVSTDGGSTFRPHQEADRRGFSAVAPGRAGAVLVGDSGVRELTPAQLAR